MWHCHSHCVRFTPLMELVSEIRDAGFNVPGATPAVLCTVLEENNGALEMAQTP
jgi:hypothetical protein